jgi:hypothetical protein
MRKILTFMRREAGLSVLLTDQVPSRELMVEIYRLEKWRDKGPSGIYAALKERETDPVQA